jgi:flagellar export protein FliJ
MKKFSFRLDRLLNYRKYLEKQAQKNLFNAKNEALKREKVLEGLIQTHTETGKRCREEGAKGMDVPWYRIYQSFLEKSDRDVETARSRLQKGEARVKAKVAILEKKSVRKKTLEVLKDMQYKKYLHELGKEEQKAMDELAVMGRNRKL